MRTATIEIQNPARPGKGHILHGRADYASMARAFATMQKTWQPETKGDQLVLMASDGLRKVFRGRAGIRTGMGQGTPEPAVAEQAKREPVKRKPRKASHPLLGEPAAEDSAQESSSVSTPGDAPADLPADTASLI
jgi:hypothetical protein